MPTEMQERPTNSHWGLVHLLHNPVILPLLLLCAVTAVDLKQTVQVDKELKIRAYYAGHVSFFNSSLDYVQCI